VLAPAGSSCRGLRLPQNARFVGLQKGYSPPRRWLWSHSDEITDNVVASLAAD